MYSRVKMSLFFCRLFLMEIRGSLADTFESYDGLEDYGDDGKGRNGRKRRFRVSHKGEYFLWFSLVDEEFISPVVQLVQNSAVEFRYLTVARIHFKLLLVTYFQFNKPPEMPGTLLLARVPGTGTRGRAAGDNSENK